MLVATTISFLLSCILIPFVIYISKKYNFLDVPIEKHKSHSQPVPNLGGLAISFSASLVFVIASQILFTSSKTLIAVSAVVSTLIAIVILGLLDDLRPRSAKFRLLIQTAIVVLGVSALNQVTSINIQLFETSILNQATTIFFVLSVCNFVNMFDNHDGSASGVSLLILFFISLIAYSNGQRMILLLALCSCASLLAFLIWNFPPAKIYLGDSGSTFLGTVISLLLIQLDFSYADPRVAIFIVLLILGTLELDFSIAVISRIRRGISPMKGDQAHIAHRLKRMELAKHQVTFLIWAMTIWFLSLASILVWTTAVPTYLAFVLAGISFISLLIYFLKKADA
jgi:UDP-GlcNAc:undecaprenyl-phosphate GlcNAc-1-phosphate transferase